jgi:hypothetical protein
MIICGVVKNSQRSIERNLLLARQLGKEHGGHYKIVIYENNSTDGTKAILSKYQYDMDCKIIMEDIPEEVIKKTSKAWAYTKITGSDHPCRIEQIANARNRLIDEITTPAYESFSIVVMIDMDALHWDVAGVMDSVQYVKKNSKLVIYANSQPYYDYFALRRHKHTLFGPEVIGEAFWSAIEKDRIICKDDMVSVYSAFNGIGVFHTSAFSKSRYSAIMSAPVMETYEYLMKRHNDVYLEYAKNITQPCSKFPGGIISNGVCYKNNSGYDQPIICEHVPFNFQLLKHDYKIFINPKMMYYWSS